MIKNKCLSGRSNFTGTEMMPRLCHTLETAVVISPEENSELVGTSTIAPKTTRFTNLDPHKDLGHPGNRGQLERGTIELQSNLSSPCSTSTPVMRNNTCSHSCKNRTLTSFQSKRCLQLLVLILPSLSLMENLRKGHNSSSSVQLKSQRRR